MILTILLLVAVFFSALTVSVLWRRFSATEDSILGMISSLGVEVAHLKEWRDTYIKENADLAEAIDALNKRFDGLPVEDIQAKYDAERAWNEGVQNILNFGLDTMNKGDANG